jgi:hypothetical protein
MVGPLVGRTGWQVVLTAVRKPPYTNGGEVGEDVYRVLGTQPCVHENLPKSDISVLELAR